MNKKMNYQQFLNEVIAGGRAGAIADYTRDDQKLMLAGAMEGFDACINQTPDQLRELLAAAGQRLHQAYLENADDYWKHQCYWAEIEFVCNVVSAMLMNEGQEPIVLPTARGAMRASEILSQGVATP